MVIKTFVWALIVLFGLSKQVLMASDFEIALMPELTQGTMHSVLSKSLTSAAGFNKNAQVLLMTLSGQGKNIESNSVLSTHTDLMSGLDQRQVQTCFDQNYAMLSHHSWVHAKLGRLRSLQANLSKQTRLGSGLWSGSNQSQPYEQFSYCLTTRRTKSSPLSFTDLVYGRGLQDRLSLSLKSPSFESSLHWPAHKGYDGLGQVKMAYNKNWVFARYNLVSALSWYDDRLGVGNEADQTKVAKLWRLQQSLSLGNIDLMTSWVQTVANQSRRLSQVFWGLDYSWWDYFELGPLTIGGGMTTQDDDRLFITEQDQKKTNHNRSYLLSVHQRLGPFAGVFLGLNHTRAKNLSLGQSSTTTAMNLGVQLDWAKRLSRA